MIAYCLSITVLNLNKQFSLREMRSKVWDSRLSSGLFDCKLYAHDLERLYSAIYEKYSLGLPFDHITLKSTDSIVMAEVVS